MCMTTSGSVGGTGGLRTEDTGPSRQSTGNDASVRAERAKPHEPACAGRLVPCAPLVSSRILGAGVVVAGVCTSMSAVSSTNRGKPAKRPCSVAVTTAIEDQLPLCAFAVNSSRLALEDNRSHPPESPLLITSVAPCKPTSVPAAILTHSVVYRCFCVCTSALTARIRKPPSCA